MSIPLIKIDPKCTNNIELIDANMCLGDSLDIFNNNLINLTNGADKLSQDLSNSKNNVDGLSFYSLSADMVAALNNIEIINKIYQAPYTLLQQNSAVYPHKQFSLYYPNILNLESYINSSDYSSSANNDIKNWLTNNFSPNSFSENQIVNVFLTFNHVNSFTFYFEGDYQEHCTPSQSSDNTVSCDGCGNINYGVGLCNHDTGGHHWCDNAYSYCSTTLVASQQSYTCQGHIGDTKQVSDNDITGVNYVDVGNSGALRITYSQDCSDTFIARIIKQIYLNKKNAGVLSWVIKS